MTAPARFLRPLEIYRGDTFSRSFLMGNRDPQTNEFTPLDLTAYGDVWAAQLRKSDTAPEAVSLVVDSSQADVGRIVITLDSDSTLDLPSRGVWDIQVVDTTTNPITVRTLARGDFVLTQDVTR